MDAANLTLSRARAQTVRDYLVAHGFPAVPVNVAGAGATQLIKTLASCPGSGQAQIACLAPDRRVTVTLNP
jgi:OOP family OmpA-OmpF porin